MPEYTITQSDFSSGAVDPIARGTKTGQLYLTGLAKADNIFFWPTGAAYKRPGTTRLSMTFAGLSMDTVKMANLNTGANEYIVIFVDRKIYIYHTNADIAAVVESVYEGDSISRLSLAQASGSLYIVSREYAPRRLSAPQVLYRDWTIPVAEEWDWTDGAWVEGNKTPATFEPTPDYNAAAACPDTGIVLSVDWHLVAVDFVGNSRLVGEGNWPKVQAFKGGRWILGSTSLHPDTVWVSRSADTDGNPRYNDFTLADEYTLTTTTTIQTYAYSDGTEARKAVQSTNSVETPRQADDVETEYDIPGISEEQTDFDGKTMTVTTTRHVKVEFTAKVLDSHAVELVESEMAGSRMSWMFVQARLLVGYGRSVWMDGGQAITPASFDLNKTLTVGMGAVPPVAFGSMVFLAGSGSRTVYAIRYDDNSGGFAVGDIGAPARSLLESDIMQMVVVEGEITVLFVLCADGTLSACTIGATSYGWSRIVIPGTKVLGIVRFALDDADALGMIVERGGVSTLETLRVGAPDEERVYLDECVALRKRNDGRFAIPDRRYPAGSEVSIVADGAYVGETTVASGQTPVDGTEGCGTVYAGRIFSSEMELLDPAMPANGTSVGKRKQLTGMVVQVFRSRRFLCGEEGHDPSMVNIPVYGKDVYGTLPPLYTGSIRVPVTGTVTDESMIRLVSCDPYPLCVVAVTGKYSIKEV